MREYKSPWNKFSPAIEEKVIALKEMNPALTVSEACRMFKRQRIKISPKGVWGVWRRFGLIGFIKAKFATATDFRKFTYISPEIAKAVERIKTMIKENEINEAAEMINSLPICPDDEILMALPKGLLSLRRKVDRLMAESGKIPLSRYRKNAETLRKKLERRKMYYSALRVGIEECGALTWLGDPKKLLRLTRKLKRRARGLRDPWVHFALLIFEGYALADLLKIREALKCAKKCRFIIRNVPNSYFYMGELSGLYYMLGNYQKAIYWATEALKGVRGEYQKELHATLIGFLTTSGDYRAIQKILKKEELEKWGYHIRILLCKALAYLNHGDFQGASSLASEALHQSKREEIKAFFFLATFILACCHAAAGKIKEAKNLLKRYSPLLKKYGLIRDYYMRQILLGSLSLPKEVLLVPYLRLTYLFFQANLTRKARDYRKALIYARSQKLLGLFARLALFFPEPVISLLKKGKNPQLPRAFLEMPIFQIEPSIYSLKFLGRLQVFKGEKLLPRLRLSPKDAAFLIYLSINKNRKILLEDLYRNFWPKSSRPSRNLSHLLVRIKKKLGLSSHLLRIRGDFLMCRFYLTTDYEYFNEILVQARALARGGEWGFARREYLRAFRLFRGMPFKKMFDPWSDELQRAILNKLEHDTITFVRTCLEHKYKSDARKVLTKVAKIIPYSEEIARLQGEITSFNVETVVS